MNDGQLSVSGFRAEVEGLGLIGLKIQGLGVGIDGVKIRRLDFHLVSLHECLELFPVLVTGLIWSQLVPAVM